MINRTMGAAEWAMLILLSIVWGGSFFFYAVTVKELPTFTIVFLRLSLGSIGLWLIAWAIGLALQHRPRLWRDFFIMGLLNNAIPFSLIVWGQHEVGSGVAAILSAATPFFTVLIANRLTADERLSWNRLLGALIGLSGVAAMMGADILRLSQSNLLSQLAIVAATVFYAFASVFGRRFFTVPPLITAAGQSAGSSLILLPVMLVIDRPWQLSPPSLHIWLAIAGLAILCTSLAYILYFTILKRAGATNIMLVTFLVPVSAILLGTMFLGERLDIHHVLGMAAITFGLALIDGRVLTFLKPRRA
jgi:drug/metabolite transporter (DMT)-like permease